MLHGLTLPAIGESEGRRGGNPPTMKKEPPLPAALVVEDVVLGMKDEGLYTARSARATRGDASVAADARQSHHDRGQCSGGGRNN
jgi:hypothetical protein